MKINFLILLSILSIVILSCDDGVKFNNPNDQNADITDSSDSQNDEDKDSTDTIADEDSNEQSNSENPSKEQGELDGECYPNKTCNDGLICDKDNNICIKDSESSENNDADTMPDNSDSNPDEDTDADLGDSAPDNDTDTDSGDSTPDQDTDTDSGDSAPDQDTDTDSGDSAPDNDNPTDNNNLNSGDESGNQAQAGKVGAPCTSDNQCTQTYGSGDSVQDAICLFESSDGFPGFPGGYCSFMCDATDHQACDNAGGVYHGYNSWGDGYCFHRCTKPSDCRVGYRCSNKIHACLPDCNKAGYACHLGVCDQTDGVCLNPKDPSDPCSLNPCKNVANSTKECSVFGGTTYKCECNSGYYWDGSTCGTTQTKTVACTGLISGAEWNTVSEIIQIWDDYLGQWAPSNEGVYNKTASTNRCRYKCKENYFWNGSECVSPCDPNPCGLGTCTAINISEYSCKC